MSIRGVLFLVVVCAGCYDPPTGACGIRCDTTCPGDLVCGADHLCAPKDGTGCEVPAIGFAQITLGGRHACGLDTDGVLYCWGDNREGQIGVGAPEPMIPRPTKVTGTWLAVAAGGTHTCGIRSDGVLLCWGENNVGQRGAQGNSVDTPTEVQFGLAAHPAFDHISSGTEATCALGAGQLWCWGGHDSLGMTQPSSVATRIGTIDDFDHVALGADFGCASSATAGVQCWGLNDDAIVAFPATNNTQPPTRLQGLPAGPVQVLEGGANDMCAIVGGALWCWGDGELIDGMPRVPERVTQLGTETGWTGVAIGDQRICGLLRGHAYCWGNARGDGVLGDGLWQDSLSLTEAKDLGPAERVAQNVRSFGFSEDFACLINGAKLSCWGENAFGELGLDEATWVPTPAEVNAPQGLTWKHVVSGEAHSCAIASDGTLHCWGENDHGAVVPSPARGLDQPCVAGQPCDYARPTPAPISSPDEVILGGEYTCARKGTTISCWGITSGFVLGADTATHGPTTLMAPQSTFDKLIGGSAGTCGHLADDHLACWGDVASTFRMTPTVHPSVELVGVTDISFGDNWGCGLRGTARVCWGTNEAGQQGLGNKLAVAAPTATAVPAITNLAARGLHICTITTANTVSCWGGNDRGQSGTTGTNTQLVPNTVNDAAGPLADCHSIAVSYRHSCAVCGGKPVCWGEGGFAQLGRGFDDLLDSSIALPVRVPAALTYTEVSAFEGGGCALSDGGRLFCWGDSARGSVGTGASAKSLPTPVASGM